MLIRDQIYTQSRGFVNEYRIINREQRGNVWHVTINATVDDQPNSKLMNELTRLGIINVQLRNPKIAVYVPEQHLNYHVGGAGGEIAIVKTLLNAGFSNVIEVGTGLSYQKPMNMNAAQMKSAAEKFGADIMIVGESFSEGVGDMGNYLPGNQRMNMQACRARVVFYGIRTRPCRFLRDTCETDARSSAPVEACAFERGIVWTDGSAASARKGVTFSKTLTRRLAFVKKIRNLIKTTSSI